MTSQPWPPQLDAVVAAPRHHRVLLENAHVRVLETWIAPGEIVPLHTHQWPAVYYILQAGDFIRRDDRGVVTGDSRQNPPGNAGDVVWATPLGPHTLENVGATPIHVVSVETKLASI
ncbi:MAG: hypothetical protein JSS51_14775 [Planctomycetes bacterium]|nr:hypothetical protein [Planctomycetota bacterium]